MGNCTGRVEPPAPGVVRQEVDQQIGRVLRIFNEALVLLKYCDLRGELGYGRAGGRSAQSPYDGSLMLRLAVIQEHLRLQTGGERFGHVAWILSAHRDADTEGSAFARQFFETLAVLHPPGFVEDEQASKRARLSATDEVPLEPDDDEFGDGSLDPVLEDCGDPVRTIS